MEISWSKSKFLMPNLRWIRIPTQWIRAFRPLKLGWAVIMTGEPNSKCRIKEDKTDKIWVPCPKWKPNVRIFIQLLSLRHNSNVIIWIVKWFLTSFQLRRLDQTKAMGEHANIRISWVVAQTITPFKLEMILWTVSIVITTEPTTLAQKVWPRSFHSKIWTTQSISSPNLIPAEWLPRKIFKLTMERFLKRNPRRDSFKNSWITRTSQWPPQFHQNLTTPESLLSKPLKIATLWDTKIWAYSLLDRELIMRDWLIYVRRTATRLARKTSMNTRNLWIITAYNLHP